MASRCCKRKTWRASAVITTTTAWLPLTAASTARALLLTTGSRYRRLEAPGENDFIGAGIHFCATCDGPFYKGLPVAVIGGGNSAAEESIFLASLTEKVTLLVRGSTQGQPGHPGEKRCAIPRSRYASTPRLCASTARAASSRRSQSGTFSLPAPRSSTPLACSSSSV
ncbi:FAD-dependent oxidoreductase [Candidatus Amarolinea dominans]|uniref:NAD(P)/FAD-dependent oxidoreductase n=1 Tax=Candidatus Amarolinea dominans TaxID=3140696 RepID=UPI0031CC5401